MAVAIDSGEGTERFRKLNSNQYENRVDHPQLVNYFQAGQELRRFVPVLEEEAQLALEIEAKLAS